jgi:hypothetical protein
MRRLAHLGMRTASPRALLLTFIAMAVMASFTELRSAAAEPMFTLILETADAPKDLFLQAYAAFEAGTREELKKQTAGALAKYRETERLLRKIEKEYPNWNPAIVAFRAKKTKEAIARLVPINPDGTPLPEA